MTQTTEIAPHEEPKALRPPTLAEELWPHAAEQQEKSFLFVERIKCWKPLLEEIYNFLGRYRDNQIHTAKEFQRFAKVLSSKHGVPLLVEDQSIMKSLSEGIMKGHTIYSDYGHSMTTVQLKRLSTIRELLNQKVKHFQLLTEQTLKSIGQERKQTFAYFQSHQEAFRLVRIKSSSAPTVDPWITAKVASKRIDSLVVKENETQAKLVEIQNEIMQFENELASGLIAIVHLFVDGIHQHDERLTQFLLGISHYAERLDPQTQYQAFCQRAGLWRADCFYQARSLGQSLQIYKGLSSSSEIKKEGILYRPGQIRKSHFKRSLFVLTENGFLHCFPARNTTASFESIKEKVTEKEYSIYLRKPKLLAHPSAVNLNCFEISVPQTSVFGSTSAQVFLIKADSEAERDEWLSTIQEFLLSNREPPALESVERGASQDRRVSTVVESIGDRTADEQEEFLKTAPETKPIETLASKEGRAVSVMEA